MSVTDSSKEHPDLLPTFLVIGTAKAGTTSLHNYLSQHPGVYMSPNKEPKFFVVDEGEVVERSGPKGRHISHLHINRISDYRALFQNANRHQARGEATPIYLYNKKAPSRIKSLLPEVELVVILRNPVERAYSAFLHLMRDGKETCANFADALDKEPERIAENWYEIYHYRQMGLYYEQLRRYYTTFDPSRVHVYLYDDLKHNTLGVIQSIFKNIRVDASFVPTNLTSHNISGIPKNKLLHQAYRLLKGSHQSALKDLGKSLLPITLRREMKGSLMNSLARKNLEQSQLDPKIRAALLESFREDILKSQDLIGRDLSSWLRP